MQAHEVFMPRRLIENGVNRIPRPAPRGVAPGRIGGTALVLLALTLSPARADAAFGFRKVITVQPGQVAAGPHADFPLLVSLVDPNLATIPNLGNVTSSKGYDIIFRGEDAVTCGGPATCRLDHEIERYEPTNGTLVAWVRVPSINDGTAIYMYYGDAGITTPTEAPSAVWEPDSPATPGHVGVWHLKETSTGSALEFRDSSKNANHGQGGEGDALFLPSQVAGKIGFAQDFAPGAGTNPKTPPADGKFDVIDLGHSARFDFVGDQITLQAWVRHNIVPAADSYGFLAHKGFSGGYRLFFQSSLRLRFQLTNATTLITTGNVTAGAWHHVVGTYDGATMRVYVDGVQDATTVAKVGNITPPTGDDAEVYIGHGDQPKDRAWSYEWVGQMDEVRISRTARSAAWILTEYRNQNTPGSFYSVGAQTPGPYATPAFTLLSLNYRSIGTNGGILHSAGDASVAFGSSTVSFAGAANLPATIGPGDTLTFTGAPAETLYIQWRDSATQVTVQTPATSAHTNQTYTITRSFTALAAWEAARQGDLVTENRREVGVAYNDGPFTTGLAIAGWTVDSVRYPMLMVGPGQRHNGTAGTGVVLDGVNTDQGIRASTSFTVVDGFEFRRNRGAASAASVVVQNSAYDVVLRNLLIYDFVDGANSVSGIRGQSDSDYTVLNSILYGGETAGIRNNAASANGIVENVTVYGMAQWGVLRSAGNLVVRNTISMGNPSGDFSGTMTQAYNISADPSAAGNGSQPGRAVANQFVSTAAGSEDLHLKVGSDAIDTAFPAYMPQYWTDVDGASRLFTPVPLPGTPGPWDIGADEFGATTAVELLSFDAQPADSAVNLSWRTGSELNNLGFHLHRSLSKLGPWSRITASLIPGLGSSPEGASYSFRDTGLTNGVECFYFLEDIDSSSVSTFHGPVSAIPAAVLPPEEEEPGEGTPPDDPSSPGEPPVQAYGTPEGASLRTLSRTATSLTLELSTPGFYATETEAGHHFSIPGFDDPTDPTAAAIPFRRAVVGARVGKTARIAWVRHEKTRTYPGLAPAAVGEGEMIVGWDGTVRPGRRPQRLRKSNEGLLPELPARIAGDAFIGEKKKLALELSPLRFDTLTGEMRLTRKLRVKIVFDRPSTAKETGSGSTGRSEPDSVSKKAPKVLAYLHTRQTGLHAVSFKTLFPTGRKPLPLKKLRLSLQGHPVAFHVQPQREDFRKGSVLYFYASTEASSTEYSSETTYALEEGRGGVPMRTVSAVPKGKKRVTPLLQEDYETNRYYQAGLLQAPDIWLWDFMTGGTSKSFPFTVEGLAEASSQSAHLHVVFQGASDAEDVEEEHHLSVAVNGTPVGETAFGGKLAHVFTTGLPASLLQEGENELTLTNAGDTGAYSFVFLDRVHVVFPETSGLREGRFDGFFPEGGVATVVGNARYGVDVTNPTSPKWLTRLKRGGGKVRLQAQAQHRYLLASRAGLLAPRVSKPLVSSLRQTTHQADYVVIAPAAYLEAAEPLLERRRDQGLSAMAVSFEEITSVFGHGRPSAEAIRDFLAYAYHSWTGPSLQYVLLLGDSSYDPRNFTGLDQGSPLPVMWAKTSYLWTSSDPTLGAINGEDLLPDVAIGRLPARTLEEAHALVQKVLDWEGQDLEGPAILVADNPDQAGDFEADVLDIEASYLTDRPTQTLFLRELGAGTRPQILSAFDGGASLMSYVGHGGAAVWASENVLNSWDPPKLLAQSRQPLMLTFNCLNGYFVAPNYDSLSEAFLKVEGRGTVAAFTPSGLSLDAPAHRFHRALMAEITGGAHERLGDAVLAAQAAYAETGVMPELLAIYHLLADPGMRIR